MGGLWPSATKEDYEAGWTLSYKFLETVQNTMRERESEYSTSLEVIENCLLSASKVEIKEESMLNCDYIPHTVSKYDDTYHVRCGHDTVYLARAPKYCPSCGENIEEEVSKLETPRP